MTLKEKIAQMLIITPDEKNFETSIKEMIEKYQIGGVVLYSKNYNSYQEMIEKINFIKKCNKLYGKTPIWISIDQEGGRVNRFPDEIENIKNAYSIGKTKNIELAKNVGNTIGKMLIETGINMNYAPVLDIKRFEDNHAIGNRAYSENKETVFSIANAVMQGMKEAGVLAVPKHFPGHGMSKADSHFFVPHVNSNLEQLENEDLYPFKKVFENGADAVMVGHLIVETIDKKMPASLSKKIITEMLKNKYKFKGLIVTDDLKMLAIRLMFSTEDAVSNAILAGNDSILLGIEYKKIENIINKIEKRVNDGFIPLEIIEASANKNIKMKKAYNINDEQIKRNGYRIL